MDFLSPPFQFFHPQPGVTFDLLVRRWEIGLATRPIRDPPFQVTKPTIRFHLVTPIPPSLWLAVRTSGSVETARVTPQQLADRPYIDFTNAPLMANLLELYDRRLVEVVKGPREVDARLALALHPEAPEPLTIRLRRNGLGIDTLYDLEIVGP